MSCAAATLTPGPQTLGCISNTTSGYVDGVQGDSEVHVAEKTGTTPAVGEKIPNFELPDEQGRPFNLARELEGGPIVLVFYRGDW